MRIMKRPARRCARLRCRSCAARRHAGAQAPHAGAAAGAASARRQPGATRRTGGGQRPRRRPGDDAHVDRLARWRRRFPRSTRRRGGQCRRRCRGATCPTAPQSFVLIVHDLDAAIGNWHRRPAALDGVEHSRRPRRACPRACRRGRSCRTARGRSAPAARTIAGPPPRQPVPRITTSSSCTRSTRTINVAAVGESPAATRAAVMAAMAGHIRGKGVYTGLYKRGQ